MLNTHQIGTDAHTLLRPLNYDKTIFFLVIDIFSKFTEYVFFEIQLKEKSSYFL